MMWHNKKLISNILESVLINHVTFNLLKCNNFQIEESDMKLTGKSSIHLKALFSNMSAYKSCYFVIWKEMSWYEMTQCQLSCLFKRDYELIKWLFIKPLHYLAPTEAPSWINSNISRCSKNMNSTIGTFYFHNYLYLIQISYHYKKFNNVPH